MRGFRVSLFGVRLAVASDSAAMAQALDRYVLPWLPRSALDGEATDRRVEVRGAAEGGGFEILVDGAVAHASPDPLAAIPPVQRALDEAVVRLQTDVAVVHGGVVGHAGRVILLPGSTGAGKSTLVAELVRQGATYFSDEYALIDKAGRAHPYPRPLFLRDGPGDGRPVLATDLGGTVAREPAPVGLVLELRYAPDAALVLRATPRARGSCPFCATRRRRSSTRRGSWAARARRRRRGVLRGAARRGARGRSGNPAAGGGPIVRRGAPVHR